MFEAYARNKYTGHRRHPVDAEQRLAVDSSGTSTTTTCDPAAAISATKKACEPVHVQYSYDDRSIALVNDTQTGLTG